MESVSEKTKLTNYGIAPFAYGFTIQNVINARYKYYCIMGLREEITIVIIIIEYIKCTVIRSG